MKTLYGLMLAALVFSIPGCGGSSSDHDLKMVADQPMLVIWARPEQHLKNPAAKELFEAILKTAPEGEGEPVAAAIPKMDLFKMSLANGKRYYSEKEQPIPVMVMHFTDEAATKGMFEMMTKNEKPRTISELSVPVYQWEYKSHEGDPEAKKEEEKWKLRSGTAQLDKQTIANGETVEKLIAVASAKEPAAAGAWASDFKSLAASQSLMMVDVAKLRAMIDEEFKRHPPPSSGMEAALFSTAKPLWEEADYAFLTVDTTDGIKVTGMAKSATPEAAKKFKEALEALLNMGKSFMPTLKPMVVQLKLKSADEVDKIYSEVDAAIKSLSITQDGTTTKLALNIKQDTVNQVVKGFLVPLLEQEATKAKERRERWKKEEAKMKEDAAKPFNSAGPK